MLKPYLQLVRLPATFSAWSNVIAAHVIATGGTPLWSMLALQIAISTALYWAGMILNDCFDLAEDREERPSRPIPSGRVPARIAWALGWLLMVAAVALAALAGPVTLWITLSLALAILVYDGVLKGGPVGPFAMGLCRYLNWILGLAAAPLGVGALLLPLPVHLYTAAVTVLSTRETGGADRRTLAQTALLLAGAGCAAAALYPLGVLDHPLYLLALALASYPLAVRLRHMAVEDDPTATQQGVRWLLLGMIPLDALLLTGSGHPIAAVALLTLLVPARLLGRRLYLT